MKSHACLCTVVKTGFHRIETVRVYLGHQTVGGGSANYLRGSTKGPFINSVTRDAAFFDLNFPPPPFVTLVTQNFQCILGRVTFENQSKFTPPPLSRVTDFMNGPLRSMQSNISIRNHTKNPDVTAVS